jgi:hypothetical protein
MGCGSRVFASKGDEPLNDNLGMDADVEAAEGWHCEKKLAIVDWPELPAVLRFDFWIGC